MEGLFTVLKKALPSFPQLTNGGLFTNNQTMDQVRHALQTFSSYIKGRGQLFVEFISSLLNSEVVQDVIIDGSVDAEYDDEVISELSQVVDELREVTGIDEGEIPLSFTNCQGKQIALQVSDDEDELIIHDGTKPIISVDYHTAKVQATSKIAIANAQIQGEYMEMGDFLNDQINASSINHIIVSAVDLINAGTFSLDTFNDMVGQWVSNASGNAKTIYQNIRQSFVSSGIVGVIHYIYSYIDTLSKVQVTNNTLEFTDNKSLMPKDILTGFLGVTGAILSTAWNVVKTAFVGIAGLIVGVFDVFFKTVDMILDLTRPTLNDSLEEVVYPTTPMGFFQYELQKECFSENHNLDAIVDYVIDGNYALCEVPGGFLIVGPGKTSDYFRIEFHASIREIKGCDDDEVMALLGLEQHRILVSPIDNFYLCWIEPINIEQEPRYLTSKMLRDLYDQSYMPEFSSVHDDHKIYSDKESCRLLFNIVRNACIFNAWIWTLMTEANNLTSSRIDLNNYLSALYGEGLFGFNNFFGNKVKKVGGVNPLLGVLCPGWFMCFYDPASVYWEGDVTYNQSWWEVVASDKFFNQFTWLEQGDVFSDYNMHADIYMEVGDFGIWHSSTLEQKKDYANWNSYNFFTDIHLQFSSNQLALGSALCGIFENYDPIYGDIIDASMWASKRAKSIIELPKVSLSSLTGFMSIILGTAVATAVLVPIIAGSIKKARLRSQGKVEGAWTRFTADPSKENLKAYRKTVFKANLLGMVIGGTHFSNTNYWDSGSSEGSRSISNFTDGISSLTDKIRDQFNQEENAPVANVVDAANIQEAIDTTALSTDEKLNMLISLIRGPASSSSSSDDSVTDDDTNVHSD